MQKSVFALLVVVTLTALTACKNDSAQVSEANGSGPPKLAWPHGRTLSAKEEEDFNTNYTTLEGTLKQCTEDKSRSQWDFYIVENDICYVIEGDAYSLFDAKEFERKLTAKIGGKLKFLVEHLEAEQPHADPKTGKLKIKVYGLIFDDDNIDLVKSK